MISLSPAPRYCFVMPDLHRPMGGQAVLYETAAQLHRAGYNTVVIHAGRWHRYAYAEAPPDIFHFPALAEVARCPSLLKWIKQKSRTQKERRANTPNPLFKRRNNDVYVLPEFTYVDYAVLFPKAPLVLAAQDAAAFLRAYTKDTTHPAVHQRLNAIVCTSNASADAVETLLDRTPTRLRLSIPADALNPTTAKKLQIAYMPRKLKPQSKMITTALKLRPACADVTFVAIENMSNATRNQILNESLIFLSFSNMEGFGLPPAEAMAAGCIVIGYTGVGGNEYFTSQTGFPIEHHDMISFVRKTEEVITAYRNDPAPLDALRQQAAAHIRATYAPDISHQILLEQWRKLDTQVRGQMDLPPL